VISKDYSWSEEFDDVEKESSFGNGLTYLSYIDFVLFHEIAFYPFHQGWWTE